MKNLIIAGAIVVAAVVAGYVGANLNPVQQVVEKVGATSGPTHTELQLFQGGTVAQLYKATSSAATTQTLAAGDIERGGAFYDVVQFTPTVGATTLTLPAASALNGALTSVGSEARQCWYNGTSTAAAKITFAAGSGMDLEFASSTNQTLAIGASQMGCLKFVRTGTSAVWVGLDKYIDAD